MTKAKKLIEVAMPIKEISAESVRDKSIRHGHISTLHLWWARRPLPVCRAVVFASLVPDPEDEHCPQAFRDAVQLLLGKGAYGYDYYKPYADIPWTSVYDPMEDNLRNRLQMFIGKFTPEMEEHLLHQKPKPPARKQLADSSLIKWDNKNNEEIIGKARKLIWVAHNAQTDSTAEDLLKDFDQHYQAIKKAEQELYGTADRHLENDLVKAKETALQQAIDAFLDRMPKVFDPFAGGGAIPLEAARLGCRSYGNDINPVAHIIQKGSLEFPQKYGKPITYSKAEFIKTYGEATIQTIPNEWWVYKDGEQTAIRIPNRLSFDVEYYAKKLLDETEKEIGHYYPTDKNGNKTIAYYWARVGTCSNPTCQAEVPLLKGFYLANTKNKKVHLKPIINGNKIDFEIKDGQFNESGWTSRGNLFCPVCNNTTDVKVLKDQFVSGKASERLLAVIVQGEKGKDYRLPLKEEFEILELIPTDIDKPNEVMPIEYTQALPSCTWGLNTWGDMFSNRQLFIIHKLIENLGKLRKDLNSLENSYWKSIVTYLGILLDRIVIKQNTFIIWDTSRETIGNLFGRQAIPMIFDYPEGNPFSGSAGSAANAIDWIVRYINSESESSFYSILKNASSGEKNQFDQKYLTAVVTDPPYYDAIAYADLSDFFYVWLKRTLGDIYPLNFATPQTPKADECTALKHHQNNSVKKAKEHFETKLIEIFDAIEYQTADIVSIMFAHQSTEAWTTLINSILDARMNITGSWALDSEYTNTGLKSGKSFLSSSVTVAARPAQRQGIGDYREVKKAIENEVEEQVETLYDLGFRGADLLTACFGQAVSVFGQYQTVEKADGTEVTVEELLEMARESAFNALLKGFDGDDFTKFYIGWLQLYGFSESDFDDAAKFSRVGLTINVEELFRENILIKNGNKQTLGNYAERNLANKNLGEKDDSNLIDQVHKAMFLYKSGDRAQLLAYIHRFASKADNAFWRVITSILELLPQGDDYKQASGLITNKSSLIRESESAQRAKGVQTNLFE